MAETPRRRRDFVRRGRFAEFLQHRPGALAGVENCPQERGRREGTATLVEVKKSSENHLFTYSDHS